MTLTSITPARIDFGEGASESAGADDGYGINQGQATPRSLDYDDIYRPPGDGFAQAGEVFLRGNGLPERWRGRTSFTILETGFGLGHNMLATVAAWQADERRCARLHLVSIDKHPPRKADLERAWSALGVTSAITTKLLAQWPPLVPGLHRLRLAEGAVTLDLVFADVVDALRGWVGLADAIFLDGFAPARNAAMWSADVFRALARVAADDATAATWSVARNVREGLHAAGFDVQREAGFGSKRQRLEARRRPLPEGRRRYDPLTRLGASPFARCDALTTASSANAHSNISQGRNVGRIGNVGHGDNYSDAIVIGAGLAGAHVAASLAARGLRCTVLDRHAQPAHEASGGVGGIFHGTVHAADSLHARLHRAASLEAARRYRHVLANAGGNAVPGAVDGLLRQSDLELEAMHALVAAQGLPCDWVSALDPSSSSQVSGIAIDRPCWFFPEAGWISPRALVARLLATSGTSFRGNSPVTRIERSGGRWHAFTAECAPPVASAPTCILANATQAIALAPWARWSLHTSRGQSTQVAAEAPGLVAPRIPVSSNAYALRLSDGSVLCGASAHRDETEVGARVTDTHDNLAKLARLTGSRIDADTIRSAPPTTIERVAWRSQTDDRMPIVGAVPAATSSEPLRQTGARHIPREPGLYVLSGLGSRGLTLAPLMAEVVAASILREPLPIEAALLDAVDAARFLARAASADHR